MESPRIVLDTNSLLQILGARSPYHFLFSEFLKEHYVLCISTEILFEYEEILRKKASHSAADLFLKVISRSRNIIRKDPFFRLGIIKQDPDDNKFVDCAFAANATYIGAQWGQAPLRPLFIYSVVVQWRRLLHSD